MINGLCREGLLDEAKELLLKMEETSCIPNYITYNVIVQGFLKSSQCAEAIVLIEKMIERGFSANASTISISVDLLAISRQDPTLLNVIRKLAPNNSLMC